MQIDSGPAAALLMGAGLIMEHRVDIHPLEWRDSLGSTDAAYWCQRLANSMASTMGRDMDEFNMEWDLNGIIIIACGFPDDMRPQEGRCPLYELMKMVTRTGGDPQHGTEWILTLDPDRMWLARANRSAECSTLLAAAGRMVL